MCFEEEEVELIAMESGQYTITRENQTFVLSGPAVSMLLRSVNFEDEESMNWFHWTMRRAGMIDALREKGAKEGSVIRIDDMEFDFID
jgi:GTP-binding protein